MSTRTSSLALALMLLLAGCEVREEATLPPGTAADPENADTIACALDGAQRFVRECTVERVEIDGALQLVVWHPDGGFRRFEVLTDGRGLTMADGADEARLSIAGEFLEASVERDRYLFPATIGAGGGR